MTQPSPAPSAALSDQQAILVLNITRYSGYMVLFTSIIMFIAWLFFRDVPQLAFYAVVVLPIAITSFLFPYLNRRGRSQLGTILVLASVFLVLNISPILVPDFLIMTAIGMGAVILFAYKVLGSRNGRWVAIAGIVGLVVIYLVNQFAPLQFFSTIDPIVAFYINLFTGVLTMVVLIVMTSMIVSDQENAVIQLNQANKWLDAAAAEASQGRARLEEAIQRYDAYMAQVSKGNMLASLSLDDRAADEPILALGSSLNAMTGNLHRMILKIKETSQNITAASSEILAANTQQVAGASQTSASVAQTTTTVEEMKSLADHVLSISGSLADSAQRTVEVSQSGRESVKGTIQSMLAIRGKVEGIAESILALSEKTQQIGEIITMVSNLASQSNMLALNASIEASRAGEAGKGFGVVAQEMRSLAEQSRKATAQIKEILSEIQNATNSTVMATEEGSKVVDLGVKQAESAQRSIEQLATVIDESDQMSQQMTAGGRQQLVGVEQVATTMQHINQATVQNLTSSRQTENAARNLNQLAQALVEEIARYSV